jgi:hypothetical protein
MCIPAYAPLLTYHDGGDLDEEEEYILDSGESKVWIPISEGLRLSKGFVRALQHNNQTKTRGQTSIPSPEAEVPNL